MNLEIDRADAVATIAVHGSMDVDSAYDVYRATVEEAEAGSSTVVLDLRDVDFIDSVGLGMLIRSRDELGNDFESRLVLRDPAPNVVRLLELTGLQGQFPSAG